MLQEKKLKNSNKCCRKEVTVDSANNESVNKNETISENTENVIQMTRLMLMKLLNLRQTIMQMIIHKQQKQSHRLNQQQKLHQQAIYQQQCMQSSRNRHLKLRVVSKS